MWNPDSRESREQFASSRFPVNLSNSYSVPFFMQLTRCVRPVTGRQNEQCVDLTTCTCAWLVECGIPTPENQGREQFAPSRISVNLVHLSKSYSVPFLCNSHDVLDL